jgi:predicted transcriptional regulator
MKGGLDFSPWHHRQGPASLSVVTFILFGAICGVAGFGLGSYLVDREASEAIELFNQLSAEKVALTSEVGVLKQQLSILESASQVDRLSVQQTQKRLTDMQARLGESKEKLGFYQRIMAPEKANEGLYIQDFRLIPLPEINRHKFMLTLAQGVGKKRAIKGSISLSIRGQVKGDDKVLQFKELNAEHKSSISFSFRYFQTITRDLILPDDFVPQALQVNLKPSGKKAEGVEKVWNWNELTTTAF